MTRQRIISFAVAMLLGCASVVGMSPELRADSGGPQARWLPSGEALELVIEADGDRRTEYVPVYRAVGIRYFSTGIGMAERQASYPPFPVKVVLTAGGKPFLAHVDVEFVQTDGPVTLSIPAEQVAGPWVFVDLPPGTYDVLGRRGEDRPQVRRVRVTAEQTQTIYLRFRAQESDR